MRVIVPCAGSSSRFPNMPPKWMLPDHDGVPMVVKAIEGLNLPPEQFIFTLLREHVEKFNAQEGLQQAIGSPIECVILDRRTSSQSETVAETLKKTGLSGRFMVKDSDNAFSLRNVDENFNYITVASLHDFDLINARNKSYVQIDQEGLVTNIKEKHVISDLFSVGGYFFSDAADFLDAYEQLSPAKTLSSGELYLSEVVGFMGINGASFQIKRAERYQDWGTIHEWRNEIGKRKVFLVSLDGFLFERGSRFFTPRFADVQPNLNAAEIVRKMNDQNQAVIYLSVRPPELEALTRQQLKEHNLPVAPIIFGCGNAQWSLITAAHSSLPFATSMAHEIDPDDVNAIEKLDLLKA